ncbi:MAG: chorismate lyase [Moraxellaceae bacterium]|nr:chorismate lyase [Moraxellaceae bacterium]
MAYHYQQKPPNKLLPWLIAKGSLTAMLEKKAKQPLIVVPTFEGYRLLTLAQKKQLQLSPQLFNRPMLAWVRESLLYGNKKNAWVKAQSIFPLISLQGEATRLKNLKGTPIGYVLFKRQQRLPNQRIIRQTSQGWQRQTLYHWQTRKLLISETFLW